MITQKSIALIGVLFFVVSGCSTLQRMTNGDHMTTEERNAASLKADEQKEAQRLAAEKEAQMLRQKQRLAMKPGTSYEDFCEAFGDPPSTELVDNDLFAHFKIEDRYMIYQFKNNKLVKWVIDEKETDRAHQYDHEYEMEHLKQEQENHRQAAQIQAQKNAAWVNSWRTGGTVPVNNSQNRGPKRQTDFSCMTDCQKAGRMYDFCQSKCSY